MACYKAGEDDFYFAQKGRKLVPTTPPKQGMGKSAAIDMDLAKVYVDAWSDNLIGKLGPKVISPAKIGKLLRDQWFEVVVDIRVLEFRSSKWMSPSEFKSQMVAICPSYNGFHAGKVATWLSRFQGVEIQPAREGSVCLYLRGDNNALAQIQSQAKASVQAHESSFAGDGTLRLWWG